MPRLHLALPVCALSLALAACHAVPPETVAPAGRYVVAVTPGQDPAQLVRAIEAAGGHVTARLDQVGVLEVQATDPGFGSRVEAVAGVAAAAPSGTHERLEHAVMAAEDSGSDLDANMPDQPGPDGEPMSGYQWGLAAGHVPDAWKAGYTGRGTIVAVLDTGIDPDNRDLSANIDLRHARSLVASEPSIVDLNGHGSHVAGIIAAAKNGYGTVGVAPNATLLPIKVLDKNGEGEDADILRGIDYAIAQGASVINMSLSGLVAHDRAGLQQKAAYAAAIRYAESRGAIVVTAAGNDSTEFPTSDQFLLPGEAGNALVVGATGPVEGQDPQGFALYSNFGSSLLGLAAPGGGMGFDPTTMQPVIHKTDLVLSTWSTHALPHEDQGFHFGPAAHMFMGGTSMATAYVSGVAALARSARGPMTPARFRAVLLSSVVPTRDPDHFGHGFIDASRAIKP